MLKLYVYSHLMIKSYISGQTATRYKASETS